MTSSQPAPASPTVIYFLSEYRWVRATYISTNRTGTKNKVHVPAYAIPGNIAHDTMVPIEKCAWPDEVVCVVWDRTKGRNGRGSYRVERNLYPRWRIPAKHLDRNSLHTNNAPGCVVIHEDNKMFLWVKTPTGQDRVELDSDGEVLPDAVVTSFPTPISRPQGQ